MSAQGHGHTVAAWIAVAIVMLAFILGGIGVMLGNWPLFWLSVGMALLGGLAGKVLQMLGFGQSRL